MVQLRDNHRLGNNIMAVSPATQPVADVPVGMGQAMVVEAPGRLRAILGSCVAVALHHPGLHVGGLAHVVLPKSNGQSGLPGKFADTAVPHLVALLKAAGAAPPRLVAKISGGANMFGNTGPLQIGDKNIQAVLEALAACGIRVTAQDVGGTSGRRVIFSPASGELAVESVGQAPKHL